MHTIHMVSYYYIMHTSLLIQVMVSLPQYQSGSTLFSDAKGNASTTMISSSNTGYEVTMPTSALSHLPIPVPSGGAPGGNHDSMNLPSHSKLVEKHRKERYVLRRMV